MAAELHKDVEIAYYLLSSNATDKSTCNHHSECTLPHFRPNLGLRHDHGCQALPLIQNKISKVIEENYKKSIHAEQSTSLFLKKQRDLSANNCTK